MGTWTSFFEEWERLWQMIEDAKDGGVTDGGAKDMKKTEDVLRHIAIGDGRDTQKDALRYESDRQRQMKWGIAQILFFFF